MKFLVAPNALKGSLSAVDAAEIICRTIAAASTVHTAIALPVADGGDGTLDVLAPHAQFLTTLPGPIDGMKVKARWGVMEGERTAVIESAEVIGLRLLSHPMYDVAHATTRGLGELIREILAKGYRKVVIGLGGSATNDAGCGMAQILGCRVTDEQGKDLPPGGIHLTELRAIDRSAIGPDVRETEFLCLADVESPLFGPEGAAFTFAPQKGATPEIVVRLDNGLRAFAAAAARDCGLDIASVPGSGAAGGLGAGLLVFCGARLLPGAEFILDAVGFDQLLAGADAVITAEGQIDEQTTRGKVIAAIARRAGNAGKPVYAFAGRVPGERHDLERAIGLAGLHAIAPEHMPDEEAMQAAAPLLESAVRQFIASLSRPSPSPYRHPRISDLSL